MPTSSNSTGDSYHRVRLRASRILIPMVGLGLAAILGCNLLTPLVFLGDHKRKVLPEFDKLPGSKTAVLVWAQPATLFDYPHARFELASYMTDKLASELAQRKLDVELVDSRDVEDFVQRDLDAQNDPAAVGRRFEADYVIYMEILTFQVRDPLQPQLLSGRIEASVAVFDVRSDKSKGRRFELTPVQTVYPEEGPVFMSGANSALVREALYRKFTEEAARKFYEYSVDL